MKKIKNNIIFSLILSLIFFLFSFYTIKDYGISWDETIHFSRGQAYLYYFLTGKTDYNDLPDVNLQGTFGKPENVPSPRRSFYQLNDFHNGDYYIYKDVGHPPLNDILAALSNYIFFQKLGILDDISSYHLFNIVASTILVFVVVIFAKETFGTLASIISFITLFTYPLFWAESHFNIKDFPLAAFFAGFVWAFYKSLKNFSIKWLTLSILLFSLGLGTKFNIFFAIPIIVIYFIYRYREKTLKIIFSLPKTYIILLIFAPVIILGILTISWPFLWYNWFDNILKIFSYYREVGTITKYQPDSFYVAGFNTFPVLWILFTTPPITLILLFIGIISAYLKRKELESVSVLLLLWFLVPILRVTIPGSSIYGGVRQISEFVPAMALLCGLGGKFLIERFKIYDLRFKIAFCTLIFAFLLYPILRYHPNENVYFNFLIGGLKGAKEKNFPSWGNSFGNTYFQGIKWLNQNAPEGSKLSLIQGTRLNVPPILVRRDIDFSALNWSGIDRGGEYLMDLTFNDTTKEFHYAWEYVENFLIPVYEVKADGVPILKIWKNDIGHTRKEFQLFEKEYFGPLSVKKDSNLLLVDFGKELTLSRIILYYGSTEGCSSVSMSYLETSQDGKNWLREKDGIPYPQVGMKSNSEEGKITFYLAGRKASVFRFWLDDANSCLFDNPQVVLKILE
mgnify:CR=1 FL=1